MTYLARLTPAFLLACGAFAQTLAVSPSYIHFERVADSETLPAPQTFELTSRGASVPFSIAVTHTSYKLGDPVIVSVNPSSGMTPATITVTLLPIVLFWGYGGYYNWIFPIDSSAPNAGFATVIVDLFITLPAPPAVTSILNAASLQPGVSPGGIVTIFGQNLGPPGGAVGGAVSRYGDPAHLYFPNLLGNTKVTFNGVVAPLLYVNATQINAVVPYEAAGLSSAEVVVSHSFVAAPAYTTPIIDTSPAIFTATQTGSGQGAILNQDGLLNGPTHSAPTGSTIQIFASGAGLWDPPVSNGLQLSPIAPYPAPKASVGVTIGGQPAQVRYAGGAPGLVSGVLQVNAVIPDGLAAGSQPVVLTVGGNDNLGQKATVTVK